MKAPIDLGLGQIRFEDPGSSISGEFLASQMYSPPRGFLPLRAAIAARAGLSGDHVGMTTGASMGLSAVLATIERPGAVLIPFPYYPPYPRLIRMFGLRPVVYPVFADTPLDLAELDSLATVDARAVLINWPGNPLGNVGAADCQSALIAWAKERQLLLLFDEAYQGFEYEGADEFPQRAYADHVVRVRSFSKTLGIPGERLGYVIAAPRLAEEIGKAHWTLAMSAPVSAQMFAARMLAGPFDERMDKLRSWLRQQRQLAFTALSGIPGLVTACPAGGIFLWLRMPGLAISGTALAHRCATEAGVIVQPGDAFGWTAEPACRLSFAVPTAELAEALERLRGLFVRLLGNVDPIEMKEVAVRVLK